MKVRCKQLAGKKNIFDLYNEQNPPTEKQTDEKVVVRDPVEEKEKVVTKEETKGEPKEEPKTEPTPEPKHDVAQAKESEETSNV